MSIQTLTLAGRDFVILPKREYERLRVRAGESLREDQADVATAKRRRKEPARPYAELRKELGLT